MMVNRLQTYSTVTLLGFLLPGPIQIQASQNELLNRLEEAQEIRNRLNTQPAVSNDFYQQDFTTQINNNLTRWVLGSLAHSLSSVGFVFRNILSGYDSPTKIFLDATLKVLLIDVLVASYLQDCYRNHLYVTKQRFWYFFRMLGSMFLISTIPALGALGIVSISDSSGAGLNTGFIVLVGAIPYIFFKLIFTFVVASSMVCILNRFSSLRSFINRLC